MSALALLAAFSLSAVAAAEDPPEIEVQPTFIERQVVFDGAPILFEGQPVKLAGTLTLPTHYEAPHPAVLLIDGNAAPLGPWHLRPHRGLLMRQLAQHLAHKGFASFWYSQRTDARYRDQFPMGDRTRVGDAWSFHRLREDALAEYDFLKGHPKVRGEDRPLILGHYFGGMLALQVAARRNPAGLILLSTPGRPFGEVLQRSLTLMVEEDPETEGDREAILANLDPTLTTVEERYETFLYDSHRYWQRFFPAEHLGFFHGALRARPLEEANRFGGPLLVAQGDEDPYVDPEADAPAIAMHFQQGSDSDRVTLWVVPGATHSFREPYAPAGTAERPGPVHPALLKGLDTFLDRHFPRDPGRSAKR